jgi:hypothetical protein
MKELGALTVHIGGKLCRDYSQMGRGVCENWQVRFGLYVAVEDC